MAWNRKWFMEEVISMPAQTEDFNLGANPKFIFTKDGRVIVKEVEDEPVMLDLRHDINCTCVECAGRGSLESWDDEQADVFERGEVIKCDDPEGRVCVEYINKTKWKCKCDPLLCDCPAKTDETIKCLCERVGNLTEPQFQPQSCYPYRIRKKDKGGKCPKELYPYEIIRNMPFDDECKCINPAVSNTENEERNEEASPNEKPEGQKSIAKANQDGRIIGKFKKRKMGSSIDESEHERCNCHPDLHCPCPETGEYKAIQRQVPKKVTKEPKTAYLENPCMQNYFAPCDNDVVQELEKQGEYLCFPDKTPYYPPLSLFDYGEKPQYFAPPQPCCTCPKPDPDPDHPSYLSTKVNVTDLLKQLINFHYDRMLMNEYYTRLLSDDIEGPCETCTGLIEDAAGCVGECCRCPKPVEPCCRCQDHGPETVQEKKNCGCQKNVCLNELETKYGKLFEELDKAMFPSEEVKVENKTNEKNVYTCLNSAFKEPIIPKTNKCENTFVKNASKSKTGRSANRGNTLKRMFSFTRKTDAPAPSPKRKSFMEFISGFRWTKKSNPNDSGEIGTD